MQMLAPDILELTRQLSPSLNVVATLVGLLLWLFGLRHQRFWLTVTVTLAAGIVGLIISRDFGLQPLVAGLLLALAAGILSLPLARLGLFAAGGLAAILLTRAASTGWNELVCFVLGGMFGVSLYQVWVSALSSLIGTLLAAYGLVSLLDQFGRLDSLDWAMRNGPLINWGLIACALLGMLVQSLIERRWQRPGQADGEPAKKEKKEAKESAPAAPAPAGDAKAPWWRMWHRHKAA